MLTLLNELLILRHREKVHFNLAFPQAVRVDLLCQVQTTEPFSSLLVLDVTQTAVLLNRDHCHLLPCIPEE